MNNPECFLKPLLVRKFTCHKFGDKKFMSLVIDLLNARREFTKNTQFLVYSIISVILIFTCQHNPGVSFIYRVMFGLSFADVCRGSIYGTTRVHDASLTVFCVDPTDRL